MNLLSIDAAKFRPLGKRLLVERLNPGEMGSGLIIAPPAHREAQLSSGLLPPELSHYKGRKCRVLSVGLKVQGVQVGDVVDVPGAGNCYPDIEDGPRLMIREGDIAGTYHSTRPSLTEVKRCSR
jgi:co-chaperonin GroES (HSP10)